MFNVLKKIIASGISKTIQSNPLKGSVEKRGNKLDVLFSPDPLWFKLNQKLAPPTHKNSNQYNLAKEF